MKKQTITPDQKLEKEKNPLEQVIDYLKEHLEISSDQTAEFGPVEVIKVKLELGDHVISESECTLPSQEEW